MKILNINMKSIPIFPAVAIALVYLYFSPFVDNYFSYDDFRYLENPTHGLSEVLFGYGTLRLVSNAAWWPQIMIFGFDPVGYNIFNYTLYCVSAVVLYYFLCSLFNDRTMAFLAGTFFVASGVGTDVIFWKCANNSMIALFFYLMTLQFYLSFRRSGRRSFFALSLVMFVLAMLSKEEAASLPGILLLMELFILSPPDGTRKMLLRLLPYCIVIVSYMVLNKLIFLGLGRTPELSRFFRIHPLYSLFGGFTAFFLEPQGRLRHLHPLVYCAGVAVPASFLLVKDRKLLLFGYGWIFITFLPQSLTSIGQFEPKYLLNSISRYLYIVSIGPALVYAALLTSIKDLLSLRLYYVVAIVFLVFFIITNYKNVQSRGIEWREDARSNAYFLQALKKVVPVLPNKYCVHIIDPPLGKAYMQQMLRAFYRNPDIRWLDDPNTLNLQNGERALVIKTIWGEANVWYVEVIEL